jgi:hypothetical protein
MSSVCVRERERERERERFGGLRIEVGLWWKLKQLFFNEMVKNNSVMYSQFSIVLGKIFIENEDRDKVVKIIEIALVSDNVINCSLQINFYCLVA